MSRLGGHRPPVARPANRGAAFALYALPVLRAICLLNHTTATIFWVRESGIDAVDFDPWLLWPSTEAYTEVGTTQRRAKMIMAF